jgi:hypothetical protein
VSTPATDQVSLETIMFAIAAQIENELAAQIIDLTVYPKRQFNPTPPCIDVYPGDPFHEQTAYGYRNRELFFTIRARVSTADNEAGQAVLLALLDADSPTSVLRALASDRTLQGWVGDSAVDTVSGYGLHQDVGEAPSLLGATWRLKVEL